MKLQFFSLPPSRHIKGKREQTRGERRELLLISAAEQQTIEQ